MFHPPKEDSKYSWTHHTWEKMQYYGIAEGRIKRIIRYPARTEEGIAPNTVAVMSPAGTKQYQEIWVMYKLISKVKSQKSKIGEKNIENFRLPEKKIKVITAWRYPGKSPERDPIPSDVLSEIRGLL